MTSATTLPAPGVRTDGPLATSACAVCPHPLAAHDAISARFCRATEVQAGSTRGCACPSN